MECGFILMTSCRGPEIWHGHDNHLTVEFFDSNGNHITTKHINMEGYAC